MKYIFPIMAASVLIGCAPEMAVRVETKKPYAENRKNIEECVAQADRKYPIDLLSYETEDFDPIKVSCTSYGNNTSCSSSGGYSTRYVNTDMNESRGAAEFNNCMAKKGIPLTAIPHCSGVKEGEYCWGHVYPRERGAYSGKDFYINGRYWSRKYFGLNVWDLSGPTVDELDIGRMEGGKLNPDPVTGAYR